MSIEYLKGAKAIFWDFDGVIKDSVTIKSSAFEKLFTPFGNEIAKRVRIHHEENGGMSRFDKLPIYLNWVKENPTEKLISEYSEMFSQLVKNKVVNSNWVIGVLDYLSYNYNDQCFFIITATPQQEMIDILTELKIMHFFKEVCGAPMKKNDAIKQLLDKYKITSESSRMIGDSIGDYNAAIENRVPFILRKTSLNKKIQNKLSCLMIKDYK